MTTRGLATAVVILLAVWAVAIAFGKPARAQSGAHGDGHAENHHWYLQQKRPGTTTACCNAKTEANPDGDCRPVRAARGDDGIWRAEVAGFAKPVDIPAAVVMKTMAPDGNGHICMSPSGTVYCFWEPQPKS